MNKQAGIFSTLGNIAKKTAWNYSLKPAITAWKYTGGLPVTLLEAGFGRLGKKVLPRDWARKFGKVYKGAQIIGAAATASTMGFNALRPLNSPHQDNRKGAIGFLGDILDVVDIARLANTNILYTNALAKYAPRVGQAIQRAGRAAGDKFFNSQFGNAALQRQVKGLTKHVLSAPEQSAQDLVQWAKTPTDLTALKNMALKAKDYINTGDMSPIKIGAKSYINTHFANQGVKTRFMKESSPLGLFMKGLGGSFEDKVTAPQTIQLVKQTAIQQMRRPVWQKAKEKIQEAWKVKPTLVDMQVSNVIQAIKDRYKGVANPWLTSNIQAYNSPLAVTRTRRLAQQAAKIAVRRKAKRVVFGPNRSQLPENQPFYPTD